MKQLHVLVLSFLLPLVSANAEVDPPRIGQQAEFDHVFDDGEEPPVRQHWILEHRGTDEFHSITDLKILVDGQIADRYTLFIPKEATELNREFAGLKKCAALGGTLEKVAVPAGTFDACRRESPGDMPGGVITEWLADVPGYLAKWNETDGNGRVVSSAELIRFKR